MRTFSNTRFSGSPGLVRRATSCVASVTRYLGRGSNGERMRAGLYFSTVDLSNPAKRDAGVPAPALQVPTRG